MSHNPEQLTALINLHRQAQWPHRACARTDDLGEPLVSPELFYSAGAQDQLAATRVCKASCPVVAACRDYALGGDGWWEPDGVWGGMTAKQREAVRRATKRHSRQASKPRPVAVLDWEPTKKQRDLLRVLARKNADLHSASEALGSTYASVRWMHARMCRDLGFFPDELTIGQFVAAATAKIPGPGRKRPGGRLADAA
ncbi:WhiB family transcriptional regulator [Streptomyces sp. H27-C3]|uniref:WhiB family transcriptional regulator n=1 Tax=Streptomyces sp. H27-C3 TaxID=3046305 RepID=UPI0024B9054F|nr:WhiB family transcriptional regulator [Streptomyces sp. H27-C3]MDJ0466119.1 WhiB family transcriptional regulator [Streptomyces sp. H27-C3]